MQIYLDVSTPAGVYDAIRKEVMAYLELNNKSFTGNHSVINVSSGDPLKMQLGIFFEFAHNGKHHPLSR